LIKTSQKKKKVDDISFPGVDRIDEWNNSMDILWNIKKRSSDYFTKCIFASLLKHNLLPLRRKRIKMKNLIPRQVYKPCISEPANN